ncbi:MAG TPA: MerR family transcriptional regulator [Coleofasciculaceae cyanobacterium]|jgi:DNA-binding transcriptional MerR regulator
MTSLTTEDFPYTIGYVLELLGLDERELMTFVQALALSPRKDEKTGRVIFTHRDIELLKKANDMRKHGEDMGSIARQLGAKAPIKAAPGRMEGRPEPTRAEGEAQPSYMSPANAGQPMRPSSTGKDNITMMVEAVSQVKEGILKDLSRLLDDKLAGLDEVVVELIRCKSENDSLKKRLDEAVRARETLEYELSRFKPVQFGFFKKT